MEAWKVRSNLGSGRRIGSVEKLTEQMVVSPDTDQQIVESPNKSELQVDAGEYYPINMGSIYTAVGAGRLDPFDVYPIQNLPLYVHEVLDHGESLSL